MPKEESTNITLALMQMTRARALARICNIWLPLILLLALASQLCFGAPRISYVQTDQLGAPRVLIDHSQVVVWRSDQEPFGRAFVNGDPDQDGVSIEMPLRFPGQYEDPETGFHYNYFRDYDSAVGRYIQSDPIGLRAGLNMYVYGENNPIVYFDSYGLAPAWVGPTAAVLATTGGAVAVFPNPAVPPQLRVAGLALVTIGTALQLWDNLTALDDVKDITAEDLNEIERNIREINKLIESSREECE